MIVAFRSAKGRSFAEQKATLERCPVRCSGSCHAFAAQTVTATRAGLSGPRKHTTQRVMRTRSITQGKMTAGCPMNQEEPASVHVLVGFAGMLAHLCRRPAMY